MPTVEFLYDRDCPNVQQARINLLKAFARTALTPHWSEYLIGDSATPDSARGYGSPTILIDSHDVSGAAPSGENSCRVYIDAQVGVSRVPSVEQIAAALGAASGRRLSESEGGRWRSSLVVAPGIGAALLSGAICPACWPALAGFLSSIGIGFLMGSHWLLPLSAALLTLAVVALAFRAPARRGYGPFGVGALAAAIIVAGEFIAADDTAMYTGIGLLVAASLWNSWPRPRSRKACSTCVQLV